jgi:hypothetical protein
MDYLKGFATIHLDANPLDYCTSIPATAKCLGVITMGSTAPGALLSFPTPFTDNRGDSYPFQLRALIGDTMYRLPMSKVLKALREAGVELPTP